MATQADYQWAYSIMDSSRVSTFLISILLIVYGSFRSLNMEQEAREREKEKERAPSLTGLPGSTSTSPDNNVQTLDTMQALCLPLGASVSLLVMFFFFDSMQMLFAICTAIIATVALAFLLLPMCQYVIRPCSDGNKISFGVCGRFTGAELLSFSLAVFIVCIWVLTGHWLLMDAMGMGLCVAFIAFVRLPSLKVSTLLLTGLLIYDVFWVFFSSYIFNTNVMVKALTLCAVLLFYYGLLSSLSPNFLWLLFLRGLVGFAIGCVPQSVTLYAEFLPTKQRAKCVVLLDCFWALGACFEVLLALLVMPTLGWKWLLALSTAPLLAFAIITPWLPESARFHVASGHPDRALATIQQIAADNGKPMLLGRLVMDDAASSSNPSLRGRTRDLLCPELRRTSLLLWFIWTSCAFCYYGVVLMTTELFESSGTSHCSSPFPGLLSNSSSTNSQPFVGRLWAGLGLHPAQTCTADCRELTTHDYVDLLWTTLAEFPGIFATIFVIERFGRKGTMAVQFIVFAVCVCFLFICTENRVFLTAMLFLARGIIAGVFQAAYVYTPEVYPTPLRAVGVGTCSAMARLGAMVTPYVAQVLMQASLLLATAVYGVVALLAAIACFLLPIETKGHDMKESVQKKQSR